MALIRRQAGRRSAEEIFAALHGDCGMFAVALLTEGLKRGEEVEVVLLHSAEDPLEDEDYDLHHVAIYYAGRYYDVRGEVTEAQLAELVPLELTSPEGAATRGRDYNLDAYIVGSPSDIRQVLHLAQNLTNWKSYPEDYRVHAAAFWNARGHRMEPNP